jgi:hypothetical protein
MQRPLGASQRALNMEGNGRDAWVAKHLKEPSAREAPEGRVVIGDRGGDWRARQDSNLRPTD